jgi:outer membrane immunogenic protein
MKFKTMLLCAAAAALCSTGAMAGGPPTWTGLYLGVQVGVNSNSGSLGCLTDEDEGCLDAPINQRLDTSLTSTLAGGYVGYNYRFNATNFVVGLEGDLSAQFGHQGFDFPDGEADIPAIEIGYRISSSVYGSIRGRAGYLLNENLLAFVTAGWGFTNYKMDNPDCADCSEWDTTKFIDGDRSGFVIGGGVEYALDESVHLKLQYLHTNFGKKTRVFTDPDYAFPSTLHSDQVDLGISWGFGG